MVIIQAQEKSFPSIIMLTMTVDYFNEYFDSFFDKNAQYCKKIVARWNSKASSIHMGNYH